MDKIFEINFYNKGHRMEIVIGILDILTQLF